MMLAGGRYACGNAELGRCRVWSNEGHPPGPLNYIQVDDLIAFIRAPNTETYTIRDPELFEPEHRPGHRRGQDVHRLGRPELQAGARRDAVPGLLVDEFATASAAPSGSPAASVDPNATGRRPSRAVRRSSGSTRRR